jgi:hypothetical protein
MVLLCRTVLSLVQYGMFAPMLLCKLLLVVVFALTQLSKVRLLLLCF